MISEKNIVQHELIGLEVEVLECTDASKKGLQGTVIDETQSTLILSDTKGESKRIPKAECTFRFSLKGDKIYVLGTLLVGRSADRTKKRLKKW
ncbi:MAG: ribonuclease P protein component 1 [archaeon]|jgi:ribonuclease P protein subunit POP4|nr:ribonuclease P protein component 1 [Euryarchaeota archaeon]MDP7260786.1 ribonuclease P protein component 1 [archaeon]|tara:strand:+ start:27388 stop:27666 length:279 start_codon:yes stop_codon:yes gene_type:complete